VLGMETYPSVLQESAPPKSPPQSRLLTLAEQIIAELSLIIIPQSCNDLQRQSQAPKVVSHSQVICFLRLHTNLKKRTLELRKTSLSSSKKLWISYPSGLPSSSTSPSSPRLHYPSLPLPSPKFVYKKDKLGLAGWTPWSSCWWKNSVFVKLYYLKLINSVIGP